MKTSANTILLTTLISLQITVLELPAAGQTAYDRLRLSEFYQRQDFDGAVKYLSSFNGQAGETTAFNKDLGYAYYMQDDYKQAKIYFQKALLLMPGNLEASLYLAQIYSAQSNLDSALFFYNSLIQTNPQQYRFWQRAGSLYNRQAKYDSAFLYYKQAFQLNDHSGRIAIDLAGLYLQKKMPETADSLLKEYLKRDTLDQDVIAKKMDISFKKSQYDTVIYWGEKLWRDSSFLNQPFVNLAYSYLNREQYALCLRLCNWLEFGNRAGQSVLYCAALALGKTGYYRESNEKLDLCLKMSIQEDARSYLAMKGDNFEHMKNLPKAVTYYDTAWYFFQNPFDLYFAGRIYDKYYGNRTKASYYYKLFRKHHNKPANPGERRVIEYVDEFLLQPKTKKKEKKQP